MAFLCTECICWSRTICLVVGRGGGADGREMSPAPFVLSSAGSSFLSVCLRPFKEDSKRRLGCLWVFLRRGNAGLRDIYRKEPEDAKQQTQVVEQSTEVSHTFLSLFLPQWEVRKIPSLQKPFVFSPAVRQESHLIKATSLTVTLPCSESTDRTSRAYLVYLK